MSYVTTRSPERPLPDEPRRSPRLGTILIGALSVAAAVVAVAILDRPSPHPASPIQSPTTMSTPSPPIMSTPPASPASGFLLDVGTGQRTPLPAGLLEGFRNVQALVPSPDGTRVVFNECSAGPNPCAASDRMAIGNIDGSNVRLIASPDGTNPTLARWSPDGTKIVYQDRPGGTLNVGNLFIQDVATGTRVQITDLERSWAYLSGLMATFTRDGQRVLFQLPRDSSRRAHVDVWSVPVTGGEPTLVIEDAAFPTPLADGNAVAYVSVAPSTDGPVGQGISIASLDQPGSARPLVGHAENMCCLTVSPDGTKLAYAAIDGVRFNGGPIGGIHVIDIDTAADEKVMQGPGIAEWLDNDTLIVSQ